jgi:ABC-type nitrate/sulfonate/bicarbonate transport system permease component
VLPVAVFATWWFWSLDSTSVYFPPLSRSVKNFFDAWFFDQFFTDLVPSVWRFVSGLVLGTVLGIVCGTLMGLLPRLRRDLSPMTEFVRAIPTAGLVPPVLLIFGTGYRMETVLIAIAVFFPILISTTDGVRGVDPVNIEVARCYGLSPWQRLWRVILPAATPQILAGARISLSIGLAAMVIANMVASGAGLGHFIIDAKTRFNLSAMWAGLLMIGVLGSAANAAFLLLQARLLAWHRGWRGASSTAG